MARRIAINGFGRIGRLVFRIAQEHPELEVVAINELEKPDIMAYLLKYDTVHGLFKGTVMAESDALMVNGKRIVITTEKDPTKLPWAAKNVDIVIEATGHFTERAGASQHLAAGARKVLISAPSKDADGTFVIGCNDSLYDPAKDHIISIGSCTTNCLAPVCKVLDESFGVAKAFMTTIHSYTNDQRVLDVGHKDPRRARAAAQNMIPTSTGAAKAISLVFPQLEGKLHGCAVRVPTPDGSLVDLVALLNKDVDAVAVNAAFKQAADGPLKGILEYVTDPIVSSDVIGNPHSSVFDSPSTMVLGKNMVKVFSWYDNEWGFSNRVIEMLNKMMP